MSSSLKETENPVLTAMPSAPAAVPAKGGVEEQVRPQPVALEIPVTVNGARTVEGSDKREPFSETTKTVLVFGHGAVVRVSSVLAPGQLIFLTNEKTKKEVVCQVVKSKNQGAANGYVELQFTEPAPGYWGMRFPAGNVAPAVNVAPRPAPPASVKPTASTPAVVAPAAPAKTVVTPVEQKKDTQPPAVAESSRAVEPPQAIGAAKPSEPPSAEVPTGKIAPAKTDSVATSIEEKVAVPVVPGVPKVAIVENPSLDELAKQLTKELLKDSLNGSVKGGPEVANETVPEVPASATEPIAKVIPTAVPAETSSEELKQKAAQLQQQLGSLLFADASKQEPAASSAGNDVAAPSDAGQKIAELSKADIAPAAQPLNSKPSSLSQMPLAHTIEVEEVKIPSWLAPLARETDFRTSDTASASTIATEADSAATKDQAEVSESGSDGAARRQQSAMFGGQLITDSSAPAETSAGSKKGLWIGIAAATVLLVGGGLWYAKQPDGAGSKPATTQKTAAATTNSSSETPFRNEVSKPAETGRTSPAVANAAPATSNIAAPIPNTSSTNSTAAAVSFPSTKNSVASPSSAAPKAEAPAEEPKKPVFGDVHLATPSIKRADGSADSNAAEPTIENGSPEAGADSLNALGAAHHSGPVAPLPVGGEVKQAKLLKTVPPIYPAAAKTQHVSGDVKLDALIDENGKVTSTKVLSGPALLHQAATEAVKHWQYEPAQLNGKSTSMHLTVTVQFRLQ